MTAEVCLTESCTPPFAILGFNIDLFKYDWYTNNDSTSIQRHLQMGSLLGTTCEVADLVQACNEAFGVGNCMCVRNFIYLTCNAITYIQKKSSVVQMGPEPSVL